MELLVERLLLIHLQITWHRWSENIRCHLPDILVRKAKAVRLLDTYQVTRQLQPQMIFTTRQLKTAYQSET